MSYSILIIDSSTTNRALVKHTVRATDFGRGRIHEATSGAEAMEVLTHHRVDLVLIDPRLENLDGLELIGRIASEPETRGIPVILMSGRGAAALTTDMRRQGVRAVLRKPFSAESFAVVAGQVLEPTHV